MSWILQGQAPRPGSCGRTGKYDLVILDVSLPDGSGFDLCKNTENIQGADYVPDRCG